MCHKISPFVKLGGIRRVNQRFYVQLSTLQLNHQYLILKHCLLKIKIMVMLGGFSMSTLLGPLAITPPFFHF